MSSLSQALHLGDLPSPHSAFQGHAAHVRQWRITLNPKGSWNTYTFQGVYIPTYRFHGALFFETLIPLHHCTMVLLRPHMQGYRTGVRANG